MTAVADSTVTELAPDRSEESFLFLLPAGLFLALLLMPFLPDRIAADTTARILLIVLVVIAAIDIMTLTVPNILVYPAFVFALASTAIIDAGQLPEALAGGGVAFVIMLALAVLQRGAMGMGDVKVACLSGCILGIKGAIFSLLFGFVAAGIVALPIVLLKLRSRKDSMPLAPFLVIGAMISYQIWGFLLPGELGFSF
jgi:prepilin signal peptidase PulO-like enzyme (type II secretory pathway)